MAESTVIHYPLEVSGVLTRVLQAGQDGPPVVFLHGGMTTANRWRDSLDPVARAGYRALALDLPGRGFAVQRTEARVTISEFSSFVAAFLDVMEIENAVLVGASLGGHLAATVACDYPDRVHQLVLIGPVGITEWERAERERMWGEHLDVSRESIRKSLSEQRRRPIAWEEVEEAFRMCDTPAYRIAARELADYMTTGSWESDFVGPRLARVTPVLPTFVVWGMDDNVLPVDEAHKIHAMLPVSTLALVGGARHDVDLDRPDLFHLLLLDVLRGQVGASTLDDVILIQ